MKLLLLSFTLASAILTVLYAVGFYEGSSLFIVMAITTTVLALFTLGEFMAMYVVHGDTYPTYDSALDYIGMLPDGEYAEIAEWRLSYWVLSGFKDGWHVTYTNKSHIKD